MTAYAILAGLLALIGTYLGLRRKAAKERDARVKAEIDRDVARGQRDVAEAQVGEIVRVEARKDAAVVVGEDYRAEVARLAAEHHARAVAVTPANGVPVSDRADRRQPTVDKPPVSNEPTPAEVVRAADEARRNARTRAKIVKGRGGK